MNTPSPKELDQQSRIVIDRWLDIDSAECKELDDMPAFTKKCLRIGFESKFMILDSLGRIWCRGNQENQFYPFHFNVGKKVYGYRIAAKAAN